MASLKVALDVAQFALAPAPRDLGRQLPPAAASIPGSIRATCSKVRVSHARAGDRAVRRGPGRPATLAAATTALLVVALIAGWLPRVALH
jgi:hypothetical protein